MAVEMMKHQVTGFQKLVARPFFALFDEPGIGKSRQVIEACNRLFSNNEHDLVVIVCPAQVSFNWFDKDVGEISKWAAGNPQVLKLGDDELWTREPLATIPRQAYVIVSFELLRSGTHNIEFTEMLKGKRYTLVLDEASFIRNRTTRQFKAALGLRYGRVKDLSNKREKWRQLHRGAARCVELNGTPVANDLTDLWAQFFLLDKTILDCTFWQFREKHCVMGGWMRKEVVAYRDLDGKIYQKDEGIPPKLLDSLKPWVLCRQKRDVLDLPPMVRTVREIKMDEVTWRSYVQMREEFITYLDSEEFTAQNAAVKVLRLQQTCCGFLTNKDWNPIKEKEEVKPTYFKDQPKIKWLIEYITDNPNKRTPLIVWAWYRAQLNAIEKALKEVEDTITYTLHGGTLDADKKNALLRFNPGWTPSRRDKMFRPILLAQHAAGGMGLNLSGADESIHLSSSYSFINREQADGRIDRPGQVNKTLITDVIATGPKGQKTIEHTILKAQRLKEDLSTWTKERWRKSL